uniref:M23 family metallopeptidase n=1 Tax=candidate division WOR-3 bacterium TaxID=2052148 RepID=A0A7C6EIL0_UNCW3
MQRYILSVIFLLIFFSVGCKKEKKEVLKKVEPVYSEVKKILKKNEVIQPALISILNDQKLAEDIIRLLKKCDFPFRRCLPDDSIIVLKEDNVFKKLTYFQNPTTVYYVINNGRYMSLAMKYPYITYEKTILAGSINSTLYESMLKRGEKPMLVYKFADILAWEIDFTTETQNGDSFVVLFDKVFCDSQFLDYKNISFIKYKGKIGEYYGIYFNDPTGYDDYYNLKGESLRKALLKSPLKYSYISSYFSEHRYHPILKVWRPHHGLDYSAPVGTPVSSIGDGVVTFKGWKGGYGNLVEIRHKNNFKSRYGHLSRFAKGLSQGEHIKMGELIGYVGSTGLSTGPHLHFELHKDGRPINPLTVKLPRAPSVNKKYFKQFEQVRDSLLSFISQSNLKKIE